MHYFWQYNNELEVNCKTVNMFVVRDVVKDDISVLKCISEDSLYVCENMR